MAPTLQNVLKNRFKNELRICIEYFGENRKQISKYERSNGALMLLIQNHINEYDSKWKIIAAEDLKTDITSFINLIESCNGLTSYLLRVRLVFIFQKCKDDKVNKFDDSYVRFFNQMISLLQGQICNMNLDIDQLMTRDDFLLQNSATEELEKRKQITNFLDGLAARRVQDNRWRMEGTLISVRAGIDSDVANISDIKEAEKEKKQIENENSGSLSLFGTIANVLSPNSTRKKSVDGGNIEKPWAGLDEEDTVNQVPLVGINNENSNVGRLEEPSINPGQEVRGQWEGGVPFRHDTGRNKVNENTPLIPREPSVQEDQDVGRGCGCCIIL